MLSGLPQFGEGDLLDARARHVHEQRAMHVEDGGVLEELPASPAVGDASAPRAPLDLDEVEPPPLADQQIAPHEKPLLAAIDVHDDRGGRLRVDDTKASPLDQRLCPALGPPSLTYDDTEYSNTERPSFCSAVISVAT